jgi:hypothetical protein
MSIGSTLWRMCHGKVQYATEDAARARAEHVNHRHRRRGRQIHPYWCDVCGQYHVGGNRHTSREIRRGGV